MENKEMEILQVIVDELRGIKETVDKIDTRLVRVELTMENEISKSIGFLADGHTGLVDKLNDVANDVEEIKDFVSIINMAYKEKANQMAKK